MTCEIDIIEDESEALFRIVTEPEELYLEYRIIGLTPPESAVDMKNNGKSGSSECLETVRYCILVISKNKSGCRRTEFIYDVTQRRQVATALLHTLCRLAVTPDEAAKKIADIINKLK